MPRLPAAPLPEAVDAAISLPGAIRRPKTSRGTVDGSAPTDRDLLSQCPAPGSLNTARTVPGAARQRQELGPTGAGMMRPEAPVNPGISGEPFNVAHVADVGRVAMIEFYDVTKSGTT